MEAGSKRIAGFAAQLTEVEVPAGGTSIRTVRLWEVSDLEQQLDRDSLLRDTSLVDPPYWVLVWSGAHALAGAVLEAPPMTGLEVLDLGAGLGLSGLTAALHGARVTFLDRCPEALAFVRESAIANRIEGFHTLELDFTRGHLGRRFDRILVADVVYDPATHAPLAEFLAEHLEPNGEAWLTDRRYVATDGFFERMKELGFDDLAEDLSVPELGVSMQTRLHRLRPSAPRAEGELSSPAQAGRGRGVPRRR